MRKLLIALVLVWGGAVGVVTGARAAGADADAVALCVGCTTAVQFQAAAMRAVGARFNGTRTVLVVNPDTALSKWVLVTNTGPVIEPLSVQSLSPVQTGEPVALESQPFANIYVAGDGQVSMLATSGSESASSSDLTQAQKLGVQTILHLTEDTIVVQLDPSLFPSYERSEPTALANANYAALQAATQGAWPVTSFTEHVIHDLEEIVGAYTGTKFKVCDVFQNGDSVCAVPDPADNNILTLAGQGKNAVPEDLPDIADRVAGGGGDGMVVKHEQGTNLAYAAPGSTGASGEKWLVCSYVGGKLIGCYVETL